MKPAYFVKIGEALYGPSWRNALADDLGVAERTVRRWQDGTSTIPPGLAHDLARLCRRKSEKLEAYAQELEELASDSQ